jgi:CRP-like cAMP-binding protein
MSCIEPHALGPHPSGRTAARHRTPNRLLAALPPDDLGRLSPCLERVSLTVKQALVEPNRPIEHVHFVEAGAVSLIAGTKGKGLTEVGLIGREGMVGLPVVLGVETSPHRAMVQVAGDALRMSAGDLRQAMDDIEPLRGLLLRYAQAQMVQAAQGAACNGRHNLDQRLARWLLQAQDRVDGDEVPLTHELISHMLSVRRSGVTVALGALEASRIIGARRGRVAIHDREKLEQASCECYGIVKAEFDKLLG